jgi:DNA-binding CsgD family transcriptional regulator
LALASSLQPLWFTRGRIREGLAWFDAVLTADDTDHLEVAAAVRASALADKAVLDVWVTAKFSMDQAQQALAIAREVDDPALLARALTACGLIAGYYDREAARSYFAEAIGLARAIDDRWRLSQILALQAQGETIGGAPLAARAAAKEGRDLADAIGDGSNSRACRVWLGMARAQSGDLAGAVTQLGEVTAESEAAHDEIWRVSSLGTLGTVLAYQGEVAAARAAGEATVQAGAELGEMFVGFGYQVLALVALATGDGATAREAAWKHMGITGEMGSFWRFWIAEAALAGGDLAAARGWADDAVSVTKGGYLSLALTARARVAIAQGEPEQAASDAHDALTRAAEIEAHLGVPDVLEVLAGLAGEEGNHHTAARLFGSAYGLRQRMGAVRFKVWDAGYDVAVAAVRDALGEQDFDAAWAEGAAMSTEEAIAYAQRGRGERKRPTAGWASLTPTERDVVRLISEGLANNDIATRLFVSPRTVQTHLTHVYAKLGLSSRMQLAQEAARHA